MPAHIECYGINWILRIFAFILFITLSYCIRDHEVEDYKKVIFFHEILHRVEEPLQYAVWKQRGDKLQSNKDFYKVYNKHMEIFQQRYENGQLLKSGEFFGSSVKQHYIQARGLFHFLYQPEDFDIFVQNACWARQHINAHMFVYAFTLAAVQRLLNHAMLMPKIYEILPRYFLDRKFVDAVKGFGSEHHDVSKSAEQNFHIWQWWKLMEPNNISWQPLNSSYTLNGLEEDNVNIQVWWHPVDYTRDSIIMNEYAKITYLTEDVDWNAYWYHLNLQYPFFLPGKKLFWSKQTRRGEFWLYSLQQLLTRYEMERFSLGLNEIPNFEWHEIITFGYDSRLEELNGKPFEARENHSKLRTTVDNIDMLAKLRYELERIEEAIKNGSIWIHNDIKLNLTELQSAEIVSNLLQCNIDAIDGNFETHWYLLALLYLAKSADHYKYIVRPSVLLNYETMLRDPLFYIFHKRIVTDFQLFQQNLPPYTNEELYTPGLSITTVHVSKFTTYFDLFDLDASNLQSYRNNQSTKNILLARQMRLTHEPFHFNLTIVAERPTTAMLRVFLAKSQDQVGRPIPLEVNRNNFLELNKMKVHLKKGENRKTFNYDNYFKSCSGSGKAGFPPTIKMYFDALDPVKRLNLYEHYDLTRYCGLHERLILPRGSVTGLRMQLFFMISDMEDSVENQKHWWKLCLPIQGNRAFGFPFNRPIVNAEYFNNPNMLWKSIKIFHKEELPFLNLKLKKDYEDN